MISSDELARMRKSLEWASVLNGIDALALIAEVERLTKERDHAEAEAVRAMNACTHAEAELKEAEAEVERLRAELASAREESEHWQALADANLKQTNKTETAFAARSAK